MHDYEGMCALEINQPDVSELIATRELHPIQPVVDSGGGSSFGNGKQQRRFIANVFVVVSGAHSG